MSAQDPKGTQDPQIISEDDLIDQLGIVRVPSETFEWGGYKYSHARDAIAAARRGQAQ